MRQDGSSANLVLVTPAVRSVRRMAFVADWYGPVSYFCWRFAAVALLRRALVALGVAGVIAAVLRLRGSGGTPPQQGGWRELSGPDLE